MVRPSKFRIRLGLKKSHGTRVYTVLTRILTYSLPPTPLMCFELELMSLLGVERYILEG